VSVCLYARCSGLQYCVFGMRFGDVANLLVKARWPRLVHYVIRSYEASYNENPVVKNGKFLTEYRDI
jgi:hypothetical protein